MTRDDALTTVLAIASTLPNREQREALDEAVTVLRRVDGLSVDPFERAEQAARDAEATDISDRSAMALWERATAYAVLATIALPLNVRGVEGAIAGGLIPGLTVTAVEDVEPALAPGTKEDEAARLAALAAADDADELGDTGDEPKPRARGK